MTAANSSSYRAKFDDYFDDDSGGGDNDGGGGDDSGGGGDDGDDAGLTEDVAEMCCGNKGSCSQRPERRC